MHILEAAEQIGLLAVVRATTGDVVITTNPPVYLSNNAPRVLADTKEAVSTVIKTSNIKALVDSRLVTVLTPAR